MPCCTPVRWLSEFSRVLKICGDLACLVCIVLNKVDSIQYKFTAYCASESQKEWRKGFLFEFDKSEQMHRHLRASLTLLKILMLIEETSTQNINFTSSNSSAVIYPPNVPLSDLPAGNRCVRLLTSFLATDTQYRDRHGVILSAVLFRRRNRYFEQCVPSHWLR